jgi:tetratricopeptide (TPR) repeat protein
VAGASILLAFTLAAQATPAVPPLALDTFPAAARGTLSRLHERAAAHPSDDEAAGALGRALHAWEQWETAHQVYARAQALAPGRFAWHYLDAVVLQRLARHGEAAERFARALEVDPEYLPARVRLAEALLESGAADRSKSLFTALAGQAAAAPAAHVGLGRIAALEGRQDDAIAHLERAVSLFPELGAAHYALARAYRSAGRTADAEAALRRHAEYGARWPRIDDPLLDAVAAVRDDGRAILARGIARSEAGDLKGAIAEHEAALERDPSLAQAHANLVSLYGRAADWAAAERHYQLAAGKGIDTGDLHYDHGVVLALQQKWDAAAEAYRRALAANPLHAQARNNLGQLLERHRDYAAAAREYEQAVDVQPSLRIARFNLGRMLLALGKAREAVEQFEKLQQPVDAETPRFRFALATAQVRAGNIAEGKRLALDARRLALEYGQTDLAAAIERDLATLR